MAVSRRSARPRFTLLLLVLVSLTLVTLDVRGGRAVPGVRGHARDLFAPVQSAVDDATQPVTNFVHGVFEYSQLRHDNARLRAQLAGLQAGQIRDQYLQQENKDLHDQLRLDFVGDIPTVAARVIGGPASNFQLTVVIDRGTAAGILKGMPVVASDGLVGRVAEVSARQATVLMLTDASANVGVQLAPSPAEGVASGQGSGRGLEVTLVDPSQDVAVGTVAVTSGLAGSPYPRGIPVGKVSASAARPGVSARAVSVEPVVDLSRLSYVDVLIWTAQTAPVMTPAAGNGAPPPVGPPAVSGPAPPASGASTGGPAPAINPGSSPSSAGVGGR